MKILPIQQNSEEWLEARKGKITGSKLKDIVVKRGTGKKIGFYQLIADRLAISPDGEDALERGHRLEDEAVGIFQEKTGLAVEREIGLCVSDLNENIAVSPDGLIKNKKGKYTEALEVKCLGSARHIEAVIENKIPDDYWLQVIQYFIVIEDLETLYVMFYDPRFTAIQAHIIEVKRDEVWQEAESMKEYQLNVIQEIDEIVERLAF